MMTANSERSTLALSWLIKQMQALPDQSEADARLADLTLAIAALADAQSRDRLASPEIILHFPRSARALSAQNGKRWFSNSEFYPPG